MKRRWAVALLVAVLLAPALAQVRGVPPSITSLAPNRSFTPGIPASITSLGPNGFGGPCTTPGALIPSALGCNNPLFTNQLFGIPTNNLRRPVHHRPRFRGSAPIFVPYAYPVVVQEPVVDDQEEEEEPEPPAPTIFEHRPRVLIVRPEPATQDDSQSHYLDSREPAPATRPGEPEAEQPAVVLIYRDGHQREVKNYAIVGNTLYDLGMFVAGKIPLAELDLKATIKANEDRGVDFTLPASVKVD